MDQQNTQTSSRTNGTTALHDLFALSDEQILEIEPEAQDVAGARDPWPLIREENAHEQAQARRASPGDHWVTIDGNHVLIHEPQGTQTQQTPQTLAAQIPCHVRDAIAASVKASNSPTADDKRGGFHEEGGQWIVTADGKIVPVPAKPGPANPKIEGGAHVVPSDAVSPSLKDNAVDLGGTWHVHPSGTLTEEKGNARNTKNFNQPPSAKDIKEAGSGMNIVVGARDKMMYFYNNSGLIAKPMKLKDF